MVKSEVCVVVVSIEVGSGSRKRSMKGVSEVESEEGEVEGKSAEKDSRDTGIVSDIGNIVVSVIKSVVLASVASVSIEGVGVTISSVSVGRVGS
jgi:hypothetical protein